MEYAVAVQHDAQTQEVRYRGVPTHVLSSKVRADKCRVFTAVAGLMLTGQLIGQMVKRQTVNQQSLKSGVVKITLFLVRKVSSPHE